MSPHLRISPAIGVQPARHLLHRSARQRLQQRQCFDEMHHRVEDFPHRPLGHAGLRKEQAFSAGARGTSVRRSSAMRLARFYLTSMLCGAAAYGFIVVYLLALGAITEPMPTYTVH